MLLVLLPLRRSATAAVWEAGRESTVQVQERKIPGDFTADLPRSKGDGAKHLSLACVLNNRVNLALCCKDAAAVTPACAPGFWGGCGPEMGPSRWDVPGDWGMARLPLGTQKPLCSRAVSQPRVLPPLLHPSALHLQGEDDLLLKHRGFFFIVIFIAESDWIVLSPWKRGAGAPGGKKGKSLR